MVVMTLGKALESDLKRGTVKRPKQSIHLVISVPPSLNHAYYTRRNGSRCLTSDSIKWINKTKAYIYEQMEIQSWKHEDSDVWFYADMVFYFPDRRIRDCHNTLKVMLDAVEETIFVNDYYVMPRIHGVELDRENPRVELIFTTQSKKERAVALKLGGKKK